MLLGTASVSVLSSKASSLAVENHRSKTPWPNSSRKADEIWAHGFSDSAEGAELFTFVLAETGGDWAAERLERRGRQGVVREDELGEAGRGIKFFCCAVVVGCGRGRRGGHEIGMAAGTEIDEASHGGGALGRRTGKSVHKLFTAVFHVLQRHGRERIRGKFRAQTFSNAM